MATIHHASVAEDALSLPTEERAQLAVLLFESLDSQSGEVWSDEIVTELRQRADELKSGKVKGLSSEDVFGEPL